MSANVAPNIGTESEVSEKIKTITYRVLRIDPTDVRITAESNLFDLGIESLSVVELLTEVESAFDITIDTEELSEGLFTRFETMVAFVQSKINEKNTV